MQTLHIDRRYNGPPDSGQGGYVGGMLAERLDDPVVTVILRSPPPLDTELRLRDGNLYDDATLLAESRPGSFERAVPEPVSPAAAAVALESYRSSPLFSNCFVCGSAREDGLRIQPGEVAPNIVAAPWTAPSSDSLLIDTALIWAALDCPGGWALPDMLERPALLGSMTAAVPELPEAGEPCVVVAQRIGEQGRKCYASTALYGADNRLLGRAEQIWIRL
ncbi:hypothetical protein D5S18_24095 [Nocardia panacis]|uniref:Thioesterase family protein n=1 Tax=Nocardia panacis TaxID=2340916 RepID=A0A3A4KEC0_9NOCA|nr:hypothetical protein [Nocardia panacis]RJO72241.1 hypothetical protein D5S18_24095 [Nocardia panacis]